MAKTKTGDLVDKGEGRYLLKNVRLSYPFLFKPDVGQNDAGKETKSFRVTLLLPKKTHKPVALKLKAVIDKMVADEYGKDAKIGSDKKFMRDGDAGDVDDHKGHWVVSVRESRRPTLVDRDRTPITEEDEKLQAGEWANVVIRPWAQNGKSSKKKNSYGKRINCGFDIVQFVDTDELLAGASRPDVDDVLDELDEEFGDDEGAEDDDLGI
jgi:hypothetical protein